MSPFQVFPCRVPCVSGKPFQYVGVLKQTLNCQAGLTGIPNVFPYKLFGSWLSLGVAVVILEPGNLAREVCCCEAALGHSFPEVLCQNADITELHYPEVTVGSTLMLLQKVPK